MRLWSSVLWHRVVLQGYSTMKIEAVCSFETLVITHKTTWCHNLED